MVYPSRYRGVIGFGDVELAWGRGVKDSGDCHRFFAFSHISSYKYPDAASLSNVDGQARGQAIDGDLHANVTAADLDADAAAESDVASYPHFDTN
jgi:hypothetical protein